ncbi:MAG: bifunctional tRNA (5-methylaminomethyl-2-thiouridine)(34)-methyltransferase MnmD/FAD-dependent 5-carboxymethylaminomethyl-2-thiouridine(34) oxidoreductase MnmC [Pseudohongiellaceae bacterium]
MKQATPPQRIEPLENARIEWEDGAPWSKEYQDIYFSRAGGLDETRHVFIHGNDLSSRWRQQDRPGRVFVIGELGFGTGLNFLTTWQHWRETGCRHLRLHFISCEKHPLTREALQQALAQWPALGEYSEQLLTQYPDHTPGYHRLLLGNEHDGEVTLDLYYGDALDTLEQQSNPQVRIDAWFLDGFTPKHNPGLWTDALLEIVARLSAPGTTLSSYSVTGRVVRALKALGFEVEKRKGFAHKRHMLHACLPHGRTDSGTDEHNPARTEGREALVIGAGLAGSTVAWSLARRGYRVTVLESRGETAQGASGNPQAVLQCRLNRQPDALWQLNLLAFLHASRFYSVLQAQGHDFDWRPCGVLTLDGAYENTRKAPGADTYCHYPPQVLRRVTRGEASDICGLPVTDDGLFLPEGGWLNPVRLCHALLSRPGITVETGERVTALHRDEETDIWCVSTDAEGGQREWHAPVVVLACSHAVRELDQTADLPVLPLRGQISQLPDNASSRELRTVICGKSYLAPASGENRHCLGASYRKNSTDTSLSEEEHREVLSGVTPFLPTLRKTEEARPARASVRGSSADFVPLAGQVPDPGAWRSIYGGAQHPGRKSQPLHSHYLPGLYVSAGHGSHGMAGCPLSAEHIAALVSGEPSPLPTQCAQLIDPWRFMARRARRQAARYP